MQAEYNNYSVGPFVLSRLKRKNEQLQAFAVFLVSQFGKISIFPNCKKGRFLQKHPQPPKKLSRVRGFPYAVKVEHGIKTDFLQNFREISKINAEL